MNSLIARFNSLFAFTLMVMAALTFLVFLSTVFQQPRVPVSIHVSGISLRQYEDFAGKYDLGSINFSIYVDLGPVFNWNVKQLFLYLAAEYATEKNILNQVVLWDKILQRGENPRINLHNMSPKYLFLDDGNGLKGNQNVSLSLSWNIVPNAGILCLIPASGQKVISLPENYDNLRRC
ncbi:signal peptidase complex subunit 3-like [Scyliorhinus canicula]|uniref:signal peptidase complex subunit 3-like n=1 Tax=Scyliorhinus canicula TaxID=7830 RepID=UPI0018F75618|nr:signal peptidase complex subunit 3-like [Scyliorhinus canicula]XP_038652006.1 signal peptidase complex subunit 3-like [Scyliorhinus canicula]